VIGTMAPGATVTLDLIHDGQQKTVSLTLGTLPNEKVAANESGHETGGSRLDVPKLGLTLAPAASVSGASGNGVVVTGLVNGGVAADHGLQVGDVILDVGGKPVATPADVNKSLSDARKEGKHTVLFRVKSGEDTKFVALPLGNA
jgi:serine protease Do